MDEDGICKRLMMGFIDPDHENETSGCTAVSALLTKDNVLYVVCVSRALLLGDDSKRKTHDRATPVIREPLSATMVVPLHCLKITNPSMKRKQLELLKQVVMSNLEE